MNTLKVFVAQFPSLCSIITFKLTLYFSQPTLLLLLCQTRSFCLDHSLSKQLCLFLTPPSAMSISLPLKSILYISLSLFLNCCFFSTLLKQLLLSLSHQVCISLSCELCVSHFFEPDLHLSLSLEVALHLPSYLSLSGFASLLLSISLTLSAALRLPPYHSPSLSLSLSEILHLPPSLALLRQYCVFLPLSLTIFAALYLSPSRFLEAALCLPPCLSQGSFASSPHPLKEALHIPPSFVCSFASVSLSPSLEAALHLLSLHLPASLSR
ncbi:unnamed protein product [Acanthosepion pharaonis]|uniref:Uncharacterized protein n=1 Tax=Acanthosepion pharaonis TaxID=158019 RepID=A0A812CNR1_ACAPH|nr:unnamed protein product [Sepia pharaonis]